MTSRAPAIGILGGGQLARMLCQAATRMGVRALTLEREADCPAARAGGEHRTGDWNDPGAVLELARECDALTIEHEFVDAGILRTLEERSVRTVPSSECLARIQDKLRQREILRERRIPVPRFLPADSLEDLEAAARAFGYPFLLKRRRGGYDGKGNLTLRSARDLAPGWEGFGGVPGTLMAEEFCHFEREIAQMACASPGGGTVAWPVVETLQKDHICHVVQAPARIGPDRAREAGRVARAAIEAVEGAGAMGVEMFLARDGKILVNELAPRVHNSGHYTIEGCEASQFENHVRAMLDWPLGSTRMSRPAAAMVNILGDAPGEGYPRGVERLLEIPGASLHLYGKAASRPGRKMGHVTVLADTPEDALDRAARAARSLTFSAPT